MSHLSRPLFAVFALLVSFFAAPAHAVPASGGFSIVGGFSDTPYGPLGSAHGLDFGGAAPYGVAFTTNASGDFASFLSPFQAVHIHDVTFDPFVAAIPRFLWTAGDKITFDLTSLNFAHGTTPTGPTLTLWGDGVFHVQGFDDVKGTINFSAQDIFNLRLFSFSASFGAVPGGGGPNTGVPEPGSLLLLASALAGLTRIVRRTV